MSGDAGETARTSLRPGLCSVTFRALDPERIIELAAASGLEAIEWGGDVHVPPGDIAAAERIARLTADAGIAACSYGSYFRCVPGESLAAVLDSAEALGVDRVRVWAGRRGSRDATDSDRAAVTAALHEGAATAEARGIGLALEFHEGTLADSADATLRLLRDVDQPSLSTYWQPTVGVGADDAIDEYRVVAARTSAVHVFSWWPMRERLPLSARGDLWSRLFAEADASGHPPRDVLLEFVPDDDPAILVREAAALRAYLSV